MIEVTMVIKDLRTNKIYADSISSIIRNFEEVLHEEISLIKAKEKYPSIIIIGQD